MPRLLAAVALALAVAGLTPARGDDPDPIKEKLDKAKARYEEEMGKFRKDVGAHFDAREEAARNRGDKKAVDQVKADRDAYTTRDELPKSLPVSTQRRATEAKAALAAAYEVAVKEYTKAKRDTEAAAAEKTLTDLKAGLTPADPRRRWVYARGEFVLVGERVWEERCADGRVFKYKEFARTKDWVEIDAVTGSTNIRYRLSDTKAEKLVKPGKQYTSFTPGKWEK